MIGIYKITNLVNGKIYIGQSIDIIERWKNHQYKAFNSNEQAYKSAIHAAFRKYGIENFSLEVLEECTAEELDLKEREWIQKLNSLAPNGYNILTGGQQFRATKFCKDCGAPLKEGKMMCQDCYKKWQHSSVPEQNYLIDILVKFNGNFTQVGNFFGVTDNAVRKWCKGYKLPYHSKDYKNLSKTQIDQLYI